ncbi:MAG TPA: VPLPA-CTERM sorting domain-containing protein, partial [Desulfobaccales bacterium]|nr:VPLPA-CTERM sorting domain-containing protein [Desulfobaccales bacterium]
FGATHLEENYHDATWISNHTINLALSSVNFLNISNGKFSGLDQDSDFGLAAARPNGAYRARILQPPLISTSLPGGILLNFNRSDSDDSGNHHNLLMSMEVPRGLGVHKTVTDIIPASIFLLGSGLVGLALYRRRRAGSEN